MSRILVTGITSPLGQAVGRKLQAEGHRVVGTLRSSRISAAGLPADELVALDLENKSSFTNINGGFDVGTPVSYVLDQCHNIEAKIPGQIRSIINVQ